MYLTIFRIKKVLFVVFLSGAYIFRDALIYKRRWIDDDFEANLIFDSIVHNSEVLVRPNFSDKPF